MARHEEGGRVFFQNQTGLGQRLLVFDAAVADVWEFYLAEVITGQPGAAGPRFFRLHGGENAAGVVAGGQIKCEFCVSHFQDLPVAAHGEVNTGVFDGVGAAM